MHSRDQLVSVQDLLPILRQVIREEIQELKTVQPEPEHMMLKEVREQLGIAPNTLSRRLKDNHVRTYYRNGGKAIKRKDLYRLK